MPVIRVDGVRLVRDGSLLLDSVSLTVRGGEHWALLGANGAGKSTLLGLLGALTHPTDGSVEILGRTLGRVDLRELRTLLGHVNPRHPVRSPLSVRDVVLTGLTNSVEPVPRWSASDEQRAQADQLRKMLGMEAKTGSRWPSLSQGSDCFGHPGPDRPHGGQVDGACAARQPRMRAVTRVRVPSLVAVGPLGDRGGRGDCGRRLSLVSSPRV